MITTNADFVGNFKIPNSMDGSPLSDLLGNKDELTTFIENFEPECLVRAFGYDLYKLLLPELQKQPFNVSSEVTADQKWIDLVNGKDNYKGLKPVIVPYVYYHFLEDNESSFSGVGVVKERAKGAQERSSIPKAVKAWREFYKHTVGSEPVPGVMVRPSIFGNMVFYDWYGTDGNYETSLHSFLTKYKNIYPEAIIGKFENMNFYGI